MTWLQIALAAAALLAAALLAPVAMTLFWTAVFAVRQRRRGPLPPTGMPAPAELSAALEEDLARPRPRRALQKGTRPLDIIQPFAGYRYNQALADPGDVCAPPYDVIGPDLQNALHARNPHNIAHLTLGRQAESDRDGDNRYTRAAALLVAWRESGVFRQDKPSLYLYRQDFSSWGSHGGALARRTGVVARVLLSEWGTRGIYPHEKTLAGPKADRLRLLQAIPGHLEPVFGLLADPGGAVSAALAPRTGDSAEPLLDITEEDGCRNRLYAVSEPEDIGPLADLPSFREPRIYLADGHHRYETALRFRNETREALRAAGREPPDGSLPCDYILMLLVPDSDPGLVIWPTHRAIFGLPRFDADRLLADAGKHFHVEPYGADLASADAALWSHAASADPAPEFVLGLPNGRNWLMRLRSAAPMREAHPAASQTWIHLDVAALHTLLLDRLLGIDEGKLLRREHVRYFHDVSDAAAEWTRDGGKDAPAAQCAFLVKPSTMDQIRSVAEAGEVMPQKSTYFYPKVLSGMVLYLFEGTD